MWPKWLERLRQPTQAVVNMKDLADWAFDRGKLVQQKLYQANIEPYIRAPHCFKHAEPVPLFEKAPGLYECLFCRQLQVPPTHAPLSARLARAAGTEHEIPAIPGAYARKWREKQAGQP